ncbi:MAG: hypothetical protein DLM67_26005 [Candidatus Nephthysia bennettiae]|nr:MAG: hypothetical protein DLM67_26005 [Candidatus Dormibacteraeota bacterium]
MRRLLPLFALVAGLLAGLLLAALLFPLTVYRPSPPKVRTLTLAHGAARIEAGVPVGYAHSEQGAIDAATNYATVQNGRLLLDAAGYRKADELMTAPAARASEVERDMQNLRALDNFYGFSTRPQQGFPVHVRFSPVAYHQDAYDGQHATVSVWALWLVAVDQILAPQVQWATWTDTLVWQGDWKIQASGVRPGPAPYPAVGPDAKASPLPDELTSWQEYSHVAT